MTQANRIFHAGERAMQERAGVSEEWRARAARAIRAAMPEQHQRFFESLPLLFLGLQDGMGRPWATACLLPEGARTTSAGLSLSGRPVLAETLGLDLRPGAKVAVLGLEFATRRRNRMNGTITAAEGEGLDIAVEQSFGNCPKYIRTRTFPQPAGPQRQPEGTRVTMDNAAARRILSYADTFFIASHAKGGTDVSHRGGAPGFLRLSGDGTLCFPDYAGNRFFNTLGNIGVSGRAGLFIPDFASGDALLLTGSAGVDWSPARAAAFEGAERVVDMVPEEVWHVRNALPPAVLAGE
ncbi:pyridoxamine 5'-phosphate oxidase family protein [Stappia indica]|uniref:pyridoxamine 5'-phosphate oxidase family protein n=1 Tax=Stappia indica TaxID=538381 RepID=UPI001CD6F552|nr:pyridoxamine 5'-phosphate oxidase family protein [Stappia indica]MCA1299199.1 pyridoxamine 5'-phosphate oxidase family protein [Stappia indica]